MAHSSMILLEKNAVFLFLCPIVYIIKYWFQAFWYTQNKGAYDGDVFGSSDQWVGLGVFFDSFDNDNKHNNPYIMAMLNDGTKKFDHQK